MKVAFVLANSDHGTLIVNRLDFNFFKDRPYGVGFDVLEYGVCNPQETKVLKEILQFRRQYHGERVLALDCGANVGTHSVTWSRLMDGWGDVLAFEAQERIYYALAGNLALNNCLNAKAVWAAVAGENGSLPVPVLDYTKQASFGSLELKPMPNGENIGQPIDYEKTETVRALAIDSLDLRRIDLLKLDIEGMEMEALNGAAKTIERCKPVLWIEWAKVDANKLKDLLTEAGYRTFQHVMNILAVHESDPVLKHIEKK